MKKITIQVPDDFKVPEGYEIKIAEKEEPIVKNTHDLIDNVKVKDCCIYEDDDCISHFTKYDSMDIIRAILLIASIILGFIIISYLTVAVIQWDISWIVNAEPSSRILFVGCMISMAVIVCGCSGI